MSCPKCGGTKHLVTTVANKRVVSRCDCFYQELYESRCKKWSLPFQSVKQFFSGKSLKQLQEQPVLVAERILEVLKENRTLNKLMVCRLDVSQEKVWSLIAILASLTKEQDFKIVELSDLISESFTTATPSLSKLTVVKTLFLTSKTLPAKFVEDLVLKAEAESKVLIFIVQDFDTMQSLELSQGRQLFQYPKL